MDWIFRLILENIWLLVFIIIGLSQFFTTIRTEKKRPPEAPDAQDVPDIEELIRRLREPEATQPIPPPLPPQIPSSRPKRNTIPQASNPHPDTLPATSRTARKQPPPNTAPAEDAYSQPESASPPLTSVQQSYPPSSPQHAAREMAQLREQADAYQIKAFGIHTTAKMSSAHQNWRRLLQNPASTRQAIILTEVLGAPRAYRAHAVGISAAPVA